MTEHERALIESCLEWDEHGSSANLIHLHEMCEAVRKERKSGVLKDVSVEALPEPECDYVLVSPAKPDAPNQNYSYVNNLELGHLIINSVAPHWDKTVRLAAAQQIRFVLSQKLTRMWDDIQTFHHKFGLSYGDPPRVLPEDLAEFRIKFMQEELDEYRETMAAIKAEGDTLERRADLLDALVDLVYVALGTAYLHGFNFAEAWRRVQRANISKIRVPSNDLSKSKRGSVYDVVKPPGWTPPCHLDLVGKIEEKIATVQHDLF